MKAAIGSMICALALVSESGCARNASRVMVVDLIKLLGHADLRPANTFTVDEHTCAGTGRAALRVPPVSRGTWTLVLPARGTFTAHVALQGADAARAEFRVGISDDRVYETLQTQDVGAADCARGWSELRVDLSRYAGRQFSLFFRPDGKQWRLILGVNTKSGAPDAAYWGTPRIETDMDSAKHYFAPRR